MPAQHCPFDPSGMFDFPYPSTTCPACGCEVYAGLPHPPCTDPLCSFYDPRAAHVWLPANSSSGAVYAPGRRRDHDSGLPPGALRPRTT